MPRGVYDRTKSASSKGRPRLSTAPTQKPAVTHTPETLNPAPKRTGYTKEMREAKAKEKAVELAQSSINKAFPSGAKMQYRKPKEEFDATHTVDYGRPAFDMAAQEQLRCLQSHLTCLTTNRLTLEGVKAGDVVTILEDEIVELILTLGAFRVRYFGEVEQETLTEVATAAPVELDPNRPARPGQVGLPSQMPAGQAPFIPPTA